MSLIIITTAVVLSCFVAPSLSFQSPAIGTTASKRTKNKNGRAAFPLKGESSLLSLGVSQTGFLDSLLLGKNTQSPGNQKKTTVVEKYFDAWNRRDINGLMAQFSDDVVFQDTLFPKSFQGKSELKKHFLLCADACSASTIQYVVEGIAVSSDGGTIGAKWYIQDEGEPVPNGRCCSLYKIDKDTGLIDRAFEVREPSNKLGEINLVVLSAAGAFIEKTGINVVKNNDDVQAMTAAAAQSTMDLETASTSASASSWLDSLLVKSEKSKDAPKMSAAEKYFAAWNKRDMDEAVDLFSENCQYEDTVFPKPFSSKEALKEHLDLCAAAFPRTFAFVVDDVADGGEKLAVQWHVENDGEPLPFTRGCSFYTIDSKTGLIEQGFDEVEPVAKIGPLSVATLSLASKLALEPLRVVPLVLWVAYMYIVFFSDGILPGANALQLEQRTWEEVRDLSLNFFLVSPLLDLPFSPVVHPMLEGVFNLLLSWAALFAGFLSDERENKPNILPMFPTVVGMQLLTSAFLLPFLVTRTTEKLPENGSILYTEDLDAPARIAGESRLLGPLLGGVGAGSIAWFFIGRSVEFCGFHERFASFLDLLSIDRVGSSFIVDLVIFALFQGWLVDDDLRRRGVNIEEGESAVLRNVAKFIPFFGMATYMTLRPSLPSRTNSNE